MQHKMHEIEHRLDAFKSATETQVADADKAIRAHVENLKDGAHDAKQTLAQARADMLAWVEDAKEVVADWREQLDSKMLNARADRFERYADAALVVALGGVDEAEKAMFSACLARAEAKAAKPT
jgi:hypothetical protein